MILGQGGPSSLLALDQLGILVNRKISELIQMLLSFHLGGASHLEVTLKIYSRTIKFLGISFIVKPHICDLQRGPAVDLGEGLWENRAYLLRPRI